MYLKRITVPSNPLKFPIAPMISCSWLPLSSTNQYYTVVFNSWVETERIRGLYIRLKNKMLTGCISKSPLDSFLEEGMSYYHCLSCSLFCRKIRKAKLNKVDDFSSFPLKCGVNCVHCQRWLNLSGVGGPGGTVWGSSHTRSVLNDDLSCPR